MYTQCPECKVAFRVTPQVLQQAGGRVRCGSCGAAFNALDYLSDSAPPNAAQSMAGAIPGDRDESKLVAAMNKLSGPDEVSIEDTGVEWRVVDGESSTETSGPDAAEDLPTDSGHEATLVEEPRFDDNTPLSEDFFDDDPEPPPYEAPRRRATDRDLQSYARDNKDQVELELSEPEDWVDVLGEVSGVYDEADAVSAGPEQSLDEPEAIEAESAEVERGDDLVRADGRDSHTRTADDDLQAEGPPADEAVEPIETEANEELVLEDVSDGAEDDGAVGAELSAAIDQLERELDARTRDTGTKEPDVEADAPQIPGDDDDHGEPVEEESKSADEGQNETESADATENTQEGESAETTDESDRSRRLEEDMLAMTANMQVDPEILQAMRDGLADDEGSSMIETVVMEGGSIDEFLEEEDKEVRETGPALKMPDEPDSLLDTYMMNRRADGTPILRNGTLAAIAAALFLILAVQGLHSQRESLATMGFFQNSVGQIYESIGSPIVPDWDVRQWQFESTSGSTGEDEQLLTIVSRISNRSGRDLPYPLVHVSLTDRYEEIVGSRVLEPEEYVAPGTNPDERVGPGESFTARVTFASTSAEATGFKLNVCYPGRSGGVRCAIEDFK